MKRFSGTADRINTLQGRSERKLFVDARDRRGNTPLLLACYFGHYEIVRMLLEQGAGLCESLFVIGWVITLPCFSAPPPPDAPFALPPFRPRLYWCLGFGLLHE